MPKQKTKSSAKKRFIITGKGLLRKRKAGGSHLAEKKSPKRKRTYHKETPVSKGETKNIKKMLGI